VILEKIGSFFAGERVGWLIVLGGITIIYTGFIIWLKRKRYN